MWDRALPSRSDSDLTNIHSCFDGSRPYSASKSAVLDAIELRKEQKREENALRARHSTVTYLLDVGKIDAHDSDSMEHTGNSEESPGAVEKVR